MSKPATLLMNCIPSTSRLPLPLAFAVRRQISSSPASFAPLANANRPKRDPTTYGVQHHIPRGDWPKEKETDTSSHPLWKFFHDGESLEVPDKRKDSGGRSWTSFELRRKSFEELHELWYILLKERNVLLTQREEARRLRVDLKGFTNHSERLRMVQKSQARVKQVISERRHAALEAAEILRERGLLDEATKVAEEGEKLASAVAEEEAAR